NEITLSVDRNGRSPMLAPLQCSAGSSVNPSLTFVGNTSSGLYKAATNDLRMSINAADVMRWSTVPVQAVTVTANGTNQTGLSGTGNGTGAGLNGTGGATNGTGVTGTGGSGNGTGGNFTGTGNASGVNGVGGGSSGVGVSATGGSPNGNAFQGTGAGTGTGVS